MEWLLELSTVVLAVVGTAVGLKLLDRARRQRALPELAVGSALLCYAALAQLGRILFPEAGAPTTPLVLMTGAVYRVTGYAVTLIGLSVFTWRVFGPAHRGRRALAGALSATAVVSAVTIAYGAWGAAQGGPPSPPTWRLVLSVAFLVVFLWTSIESLRYWRMMRRREMLGLADPALTNRFLLWGAGAGLSTSLMIVPVVVSAMGRIDVPVSIFATTIAGFLNAAVWWLGFTPPAFYLRWVRGGWVRTNPTDAPASPWPPYST